MIKVAAFIVDKRNLFFFIYAALVVFSLFSLNWVNVENKLSAYLAEDSETRQGLKIMEDEFLTYGTAKVMVANISYEQAKAIAERIHGMEGVSSVDFDETPEHYKNASALFNITFAYDEKDDKCVEALNALEEAFSEYDLFIDTKLGNALVKNIVNEVRLVTIYAAIIVVSALVLTSRTYAEVPVLLFNFLAAAILGPCISDRIIFLYRCKLYISSIIIKSYTTHCIYFSIETYQLQPGSFSWHVCFLGPCIADWIILICKGATAYQDFTIYHCHTWAIS